MFIFSCEIPEEEPYENPLDLERQEGKGITPPAVVFVPDTVTTNVGGSVSFQIYALEVYNLGSAFIQVRYDRNKLNLTSVAFGNFFTGANDPIFIYENNSATGILDIYTAYLGSDSVYVSGTGNLATVIFSTKAAGYGQVEYTDLSEFVTPLDEIIVINGFGKGVVDAR